MKIEKISIDKLLLDPANARKHGKKNLDSIKGSLAKFGQQKPIVVNAENVVVAGNGTLQAAKELGWKEINIVRTDLKGSDITAFGIADNRTSELAEWDDDVLKELLEGLKAEDFDLSAIGFDDFDKELKEETDIPIKDSESSFVKAELIVSFDEADRFEIINAITEAISRFNNATIECVGDE
jgi:ParB-like chromosome segregation protein Spo0J